MKQATELHHIARHIMRVVGTREWARYRDMRPENTESSLYNYHLKEVMKMGLIEKESGRGYRLTPKGFSYIDHASYSDFRLRQQPKIINKFVILNQQRQLLLYKKMRQPFVDTWNLPSGKLHREHDSIEKAARQELSMMTESSLDPVYFGICELTIKSHDITVSHVVYFVHVLMVQSGVNFHQEYTWHPVDTLATLNMTPGTEVILNWVRSDTPARLISRTIEWERE